MNIQGKKKRIFAHFGTLALHSLLLKNLSNYPKRSNRKLKSLENP
jgi:hypothetical protein